MIIYCYIAKLGTVTFFTNYSDLDCPSICMYMSKNNTMCVEQLRYFGFELIHYLYISWSNETQIHIDGYVNSNTETQTLMVRNWFRIRLIMLPFRMILWWSAESKQCLKVLWLFSKNAKCVKTLETDGSNQNSSNNNQNNDSTSDQRMCQLSKQQK